MSDKYRRMQTCASKNATLLTLYVTPTFKGPSSGSTSDTLQQQVQQANAEMVSKIRSCYYMLLI